MKQSRLATILETIGSAALGFVVALAIQAAVCIYYDLPLTMFDNIGIIVIFTVASLVRGYLWRRLMETLHVRRPLSPAMLAVIAERYRQIDVEGWTTEHDDRHEPGDMATAGACYAECAGVNAEENKTPPAGWPWSDHWWKPQNFRRDLVRAGALIIAELERHDRNRKRSAA